VRGDQEADMTARALAVLCGAALGAALLVPAGRPAAGGPPESLNERYDVIPLTVAGNYIPIVGDCGGVFVLWYGPGSAPDVLWRFDGGLGAPPTSTPVSIGGTYVPVVGNFDGSGCVDIVWYRAGPGADYVWWNYDHPSVESEPVTINGIYRPIVMEVDDVGLDDIFWYAPGPAAESLWEGQLDQSFAASSAPAVTGDYRAAAVRSSILFHGPGPQADYIWSEVAAGAAAPGASTPVTLNGTYEPFTLRDDNLFGGMVLYGRGTAPDYLMTNITDLPTQTQPATVNGSYTVGLRQPRLSDRYILWHAPGPATDYLWVQKP
jgi:hypothetical protein